MPIYCYSSDDGRTVERLFPIHDHPQSIQLEDGTPAVRNLSAEGPGGFQPGNWPMASDAAGVGESQVQEAMRHSEQIGVFTEFNAQGQAVFRSPAHRKRYCEAVGLYDRNAGYNDPQPHERT